MLNNLLRQQDAEDALLSTEDAKQSIILKLAGAGSVKNLLRKETAESVGKRKDGKKN